MGLRSGFWPGKLAGVLAGKAAAVLVVATVTAALGTGACTTGTRVVPAIAGAAPASGPWGRAIEVPGLAALNTGGQAEVVSVSCASAGNCAAGGDYTDGSGHRQGFVVSEDNGAWGTATGVPGLKALNTGGSAEVGSLSCPSPGTCAVGGYYTDRSNRPGQHEGFVT